jgi:hypothetical protein
MDFLQKQTLRLQPCWAGSQRCRALADIRQIDNFRKEFFRSMFLIGILFYEMAIMLNLNTTLPAKNGFKDCVCASFPKCSNRTPKTPRDNSLIRGNFWKNGQSIGKKLSFLAVIDKLMSVPFELVFRHGPG